MSWQGQFNLDFFMFLLMSGLWIAWRHEFSPLGNLLAIGGVFFGAPYLAGYIIYLSVKANGDPRRIFSR